MARTPLREPFIVSVFVACCLLSNIGAVSAQDWNPFAEDQRRSRAAPSQPYGGGGVRPGDRPLDMPGAGQESDRGPTTYEDRGSDQRLSPRGAGAVAVERGELAPLPEIPQEPDPRREPATPRSASWEGRSLKRWS